MELKLVKTTYADLPDGCRAILALTKRPFFFTSVGNTLYMNAEITSAKVESAIETMWKYDCAENDEIMAELDSAYDEIAREAGDKAAVQALCEWGAMADDSRKKKAEADAMEWIQSVYEKMGDTAWDEIHAAGYEPLLVDHGFWRSFSRLRDQNKENPKYRDWSQNARRAAFVYGFMLGKAAQNTGKEGT